MKEIVPDRCFSKEEAIVLLGNENEDVEWMLQCLTKVQNSEFRPLTVYNPKKESDIAESELSLLNYLQNAKGCLLTLGRHFNGMESATVVFSYTNPYASNFRANYLRASVELILLDRNEMGTVQLRPKDRRSSKEKLVDRTFETDLNELEQKDSKEIRETPSKDIKVEGGIKPEDIIENIGNLVQQMDVWDIYTKVSILLVMSWFSNHVAGY